MKRYLISFGVIILVGLACQTLADPGGVNTAPTNPILPTFAIVIPTSTVALPTVEVTAPVPSATPQKAILFEDDFSDPLSNWSIGEDGNARLAIEDGAFHIQISTPQNLYWTTPGVNFSDARIEVDGEKLAGPDSAEYGIVCRYNEADGVYNFYYLVIAGDNYAAIVKVVNGQQQEISTRGQTFDAIHGGNSSNHITASCIGDHLSLSANGTDLFSITDDSYTSGDVGLIAATFDEGGFDVGFDHFIVTAP